MSQPPMDDRRKAFDAKMARDSQTQFNVMVLRNRMLAHWAAEQMGLPKDEIDEYVKSVVRADLEEPGVEDLVRKLVADFQSKGMDVDKARIREEIDRLDNAARDDLAK